MKTDAEVRKAIEVITEGYRHVLDCPCATTFENAPRALMQLEAKTKLQILYWFLGESRPLFTADSGGLRGSRDARA